MDIPISGPQSGGPAVDIPQKSQAPLVTQQPAATVVAPDKAVQAVGSAVSPEQVKNAVENLNQVVQNMVHGSNVEFIVDKDTKINVIKVVDKTTSEVIRQIPSEEILSIAKAIDTLQGLIIRQKA